MRKPHVNPDARRADLARIHVLKKELHLDDDAYRDVIAVVCNGARSAADLDIASRQRLLAHLQGCVDRQRGKPARPVRRALAPHERKLWSLWMQAADKGLVRARTMVALNAWCTRQTGVERIEWLTGKQAEAAIEALKLWVERGNQ